MIAVWVWTLFGTVRAFIKKDLNLLMVRWFTAALFTGAVWWLWEADRKFVDQYMKDHPETGTDLIW